MRFYAVGINVFVIAITKTYVTSKIRKVSGRLRLSTFNIYKPGLIIFHINSTRITSSRELKSLSRCVAQLGTDIAW